MDTALQDFVDTVRRVRQHEPVTINTSPSLLADVLSCGTMTWVRHVEGYCGTSEGIKLTAGSAIHAGIAVTLDGKPLDAALAAYRSIYEPAFAALPVDQLPDQAYLPKNLEHLLARWIETHPPHTVPWVKVLTIEDAFTSRTFTVGDVEVNVIVRPDATVEDQFGLVRWMDTKTTGWRIGDPSWQHNLRLSFQAAMYSDAMVQRYGARASLGGWFNAMELRKLPGSDDTGPPKLKKDGTPYKERTCNDHGRPYAECKFEHAKTQFVECMLSPERIAQGVRDAERAVKKFLFLLAAVEPDMLDMDGTAHGECRFCANAAWCESGRIMGALPSMLKHDPWIISEGKR